MLIKPTVGRVVWFFTKQSAGMPGGGGSEPLAALIVKVHSDRLVNLVVFDAVGASHQKCSVPLVQQNDEAPDGMFCTWMPYQLLAARTEAAEKKAAGA